MHIFCLILRQILDTKFTNLEQGRKENLHKNDYRALRAFKYIHIGIRTQALKYIYIDLRTNMYRS